MIKYLLIFFFVSNVCAQWRPSYIPDEYDGNIIYNNLSKSAYQINRKVDRFSKETIYGHKTINDSLVVSSLVYVNGSILIDNAYGYSQKDDGGTIRTLAAIASDGSVVFNGYHGGSMLYGVNGATYLYPSGDSNIAMTLSNGGNVGISTISPNVKLDVYGGVASGLTNVTRLTAGANDTVSGPALLFQHGYAAENWQGGKIGTISVGYGSNYKQDMVFYTNTGAAANDLSEKVRITNAGRVGVGTSSPASKLEISSGTITMIGTGAPTSGGALCLNASKQISKCTTAVDASGNCTCP